MRLYKYIKDVYQLFTDGLIRISQPSVLNDPYEAFFDREAVHELLLEASYHGPEDMGWALKEIENTIAKTGVISLTQSYDNLLMWSHYAADHKGLVVGFNVLENSSLFVDLFPRVNDGSLVECFGEDSTGNSVYNGNLDQVRYQKQPAFRLDTYEYPWDDLSVGDSDLVAKYSFLHKSDEWIYEKEHRYIVHLEQSDVVKIPIHIFNKDNVLKLVNNCKGALLENAKYVYSNDHDWHIFKLYMIENQRNRRFIARMLSQLSCYSDVVFYARINTKHISACILGESFDFANLPSVLRGIDKTRVLHKYGDFLKAKRSRSYYQLDFEKIDKDAYVR